MIKQVYVPVVITIDTESGELTQAPYIDFDGAPWMFVDSEDNVWNENQPDDGSQWERDEDTESAAIDLLAKLLSKWGDK